MNTVVVLGGSGLLGSTLVPFLQGRGIDVRSVGSRNAPLRADLTDREATAQLLEAADPAFVVNLVALTSVDECERNPARAYELNTRVVDNVGSWIREKNPDCKLIQISTDQLYDGPGPHAEDRIRPLNYYALSKYAGELCARLQNATILRTNIFGPSRCPGRVSFSDWVVHALRKREPVNVFEDVSFNPISFETLSEIVAAVIDEPVAGTFNVGSRGGKSKAQFAIDLARAVGLPADNFTVVTSAAAGLLARRPTDMRMDCSRFESAYSRVLPTLDDEIQRVGNYYASQS